MASTVHSIPRPLVRTNQWVIVLAIVISWLTHQYWLLLIPLLSGLSGLVFDFNPVMVLAKKFLRKPQRSYIPEDYEQQRFNQLISVSCLSLALISFAFNWTIAAYIFSAIVGLAAFIAILGFCIGCFIHYQWTRFHQKRVQQNVK
ncbi:DUF4395 domain-containing protein [Sporolactobacillus sp. CPB3-1]|uniref:DUF4395 domain-containing protein n=1 Tax=Sporolactobacillus mangiferae TaxID=2940498 RepID=A0ABT0MAB1_9BACL|nr:DUF4395 domain-containing protein [Sporolactobacillus mangiferae]MCL1631812.1 DUF4395 domain-containing protein [Sporolactobacillus mangiferae]